ncbi:MAG TPA: class I SAM-dependent methyltransferase [Steroidobacteraceae bacterium]|nr:class I SAM-dependent methyltransferase [Steroidobacteraceae bacterium]
MSARPLVHWTEGGEARCARWLSESAAPPATRVVIVDDHITAEAAYGLACQGTALLWRGDFHNARQILRALASRAGGQPPKGKKSPAGSLPTSPAEAFHLHRQDQSQRARTLGALLVPLDGDYRIPLRRAPDIRQACEEAYGPGRGPSVVSLRALLGVIGAHEWRIKGIEIAAIGGRIHPHYGVFAPIRAEYVDLVATAALSPACKSSSCVAFDIGTGTGVLAAVLARRGIMQVVATDREPRALVCARENLERLGLAEQVEVVQADLFPEGRATLVVCNPPWVPGRPSSPIERGIYDPESRMLRGFLAALSAHLEPGGEGWLILSDLAELLGLRPRSELLSAFEAAGLKVVDRSDARPTHPRASDQTDPLHAARAAEVTSLWRLAGR